MVSKRRSGGYQMAEGMLVIRSIRARPDDYASRLESSFFALNSFEELLSAQVCAECGGRTALPIAKYRHVRYRLLVVHSWYLSSSVYIG